MNRSEQDAEKRKRRNAGLAARMAQPAPNANQDGMHQQAAGSPVLAEQGNAPVVQQQQPADTVPDPDAGATYCVDPATLTVHPLAEQIPPMTEGEYRGLVADIDANGQQDDVWLIATEIIDGIHRNRACKDLGILVRVRQWTGDPEALPHFILSKNLHRRHLTSQQYAAVAVDFLPLLKQQAKERQRQHGGTAPGRPAETTPGKNSGSAPATQQESGEAVELAAKLVGKTNAKYIREVQKIKEANPALFEEIRAGKKSIPAAKKEIQGLGNPEATKKGTVNKPRNQPGRNKKRSQLMRACLAQLRKILKQLTFEERPAFVADVQAALSGASEEAA